VHQSRHVVLRHEPVTVRAIARVRILWQQLPRDQPRCPRLLIAGGERRPVPGQLVEHRCESAACTRMIATRGGRCFQVGGLLPTGHQRIFRGAPDRATLVTTLFAEETPPVDGPGVRRRARRRR